MSWDWKDLLGFSFNEMDQKIDKILLAYLINELNLVGVLWKNGKNNKNFNYTFRYTNGKTRTVCYMLWPDGRYPTSRADYM